MTEHQTTTVTPCAKLIAVCKSMAVAGQHSNPDIVQKGFEELSLVGFGDTIVKLKAREILQNDLLLTKEQAYSDAVHSPIGKLFAGFRLLPYAKQPIAKAIVSLDAMGGAWAQDILDRLETVNRGAAWR